LEEKEMKNVKIVKYLNNLLLLSMDETTKKEMSYMQKE